MSVHTWGGAHSSGGGTHFQVVLLSESLNVNLLHKVINQATPNHTTFLENLY